MNEWMNQAFALAASADNAVKTNPKVGALIIKEGRIIARGLHEKYGGAHAEINALNAVKEPVNGATMVVTLEPCSHTGKTPPCVEAIIASGIPHVVIGTEDPHPLVAGRGIQALKQAGLQVDLVHADAAQASLNADYLHRIETQRPYIHLKTAMSLDGKVALKNGQSKWITSAASRARVQAYRQQAGAIMVGVGTVLADNPSLMIKDLPAGSPIRIILDTHLRTPLFSTVVQTARDVATWIYTAHPARKSDYEAFGVTIKTVKKTHDRVDFNAVIEDLKRYPIKRVLVESGPTLTSYLLTTGWVDEWTVMMAPLLLGGDAISMVNAFGLTDLTDAPQYHMAAFEKTGPDGVITLIQKGSL